MTEEGRIPSRVSKLILPELLRNKYPQHSWKKVYDEVM